MSALRATVAAYNVRREPCTLGYLHTWHLEARPACHTSALCALEIHLSCLQRGLEKSKAEHVLSLGGSHGKYFGGGLVAFFEGLEDKTAHELVLNPRKYGHTLSEAHSSFLRSPITQRSVFRSFRALGLGCG